MIQKIACVLLVVTACVFHPEYVNGQAEPLAIGAAAPLVDHVVVDINNDEHTLTTVAGDKGLLVVFICNTCPWVRKWEDRFNPLAERAGELGFGVIFLNPNEALRETEESPEAMKAHAEEMGYSFIYAVDANHILADAFGASRTPDSFLFDANMKLAYRGAIDDNARQAASVESSYLRDAMETVARAGTVEAPIQKAIGCTIKRVSNR